MAVVSPGLPAADVSQVGTFSGNEITDATRVAATSWTTAQQGGSTDGLTPPAGVAVWEARTNLFRRGQCDALTDWGFIQAGVTHALDAGTPAPFSPQSVQNVCDATVAGQGGQALSASGLALAAAVSVASSVYFKGPPGTSYKVNTRIVNTDATVTDGAATTFAATGGWQLLTPAPVAVAAGKTADTVRVIVFQNGQRAETFWLAHAELESAALYVGPYIATSQGATATRAAARVQAPATMLDETLGWLALRFKLPYAANFALTTNNVLFEWQDDANNRLALDYVRTPSQTFRLARVSGGTFQAVNTPLVNFAAGDSLTVVGAWDSGHVYLSFNGAAFSTAAAALTPTLAATLFDLGSAGPGALIANGTILWAACGIGAIASADAAYLAALPDASPAVYPPVSASMLGRWLTYAPVGPKFRRVRVGEPVVTPR